MTLKDQLKAAGLALLVVACLVGAFLFGRETARPKYVGQKEAVAYAKAISLAHDLNDLQDVRSIGGGTAYLAVFGGDVCYLVDLQQPSLDIQTRC